MKQNIGREGEPMARKKESLFIKFIKDTCDKRMKKIINGDYGRAAFSLQSFSAQEEIYIYKPWKLIFHLFIIHSIRLGLLTLISFFPFIFFLVPIWTLILYEIYFTIKRMEKFNLSITKIVVFFVMIGGVFVVVSPFVRAGIWWLVSRFISNSLFT